MGRDSEPPGSRDAAVRGLGGGTDSVALVPAVAGGKALLAPRAGRRLRCPELPRGRHPRGRAGQGVCARAPLLPVVPGGEGAVRLVRRLRQQAAAVRRCRVGVPVSTAVLTKPLPGLRPYTESLVCSRFVLLDECPGNSESWFLARCFDALLADGVRGVVSFADPVPRRTASGRLVMPGHVGTIYAATNAVYAGRCNRPDGEASAGRHRLPRPGGAEDPPRRAGPRVRRCSASRARSSAAAARLRPGPVAA